MEMVLAVLIGLIVLALIFDFTNGFHDAANAVAAIVGTKTLPAKYAPAFSAFFNFAAYFVVGTAVADTVAKTVKSDYVTVTIIFAALFSAIMWNYFTWRIGMPSSSSHAILGGLIGAGIAAGGFAAISWGSAQKALIGLAVAPLIGFGIAYLVMWMIRGLQALTKWGDDHKAFKGAQLVTSAAVSFGHGANDAQKTMGVIAALLLATGHTVMNGDNIAIPQWVGIASYSAIALGTLWGGWKIIHTMGLRIVKLHPNSGAAADIGASVAIFGATATGVPLSTTQAAATAILGAGVGEGEKANWKVVRHMVLAWITTIPATMALAAGLHIMTQLPAALAWVCVGVTVTAFTVWAVRAMITSITAKDIEAELESQGSPTDTVAPAIQTIAG